MACAAAAMGGADTITVLPHTWPLGQGNAFARRIARNIQIILQEESALGAVLDPAGGAWYVESATTALADAAWARFQEIERQGGMFQALSKGFIQKQIAETAVERARAIATGSEQLTGVTAYPEIGAKATTVDPHPLAQDIEEPAITAEPIPLRAPSEPFDRLRSAADARFDEGGKRPAIFLACLGKPADFATPAAYAQNFFAAGGIDVITNEGFADTGAAAKAFTESNTKLACICSSDAVYAVMAADAARALTTAGARPIYLAGRPGEDRPSLRDAGVGTFIHQGCDMLEVLETAHDLLGIRAI
jgi:methylmalonyl-CoA mutase